MPPLSAETVVARLAQGGPVPAILVLGHDAYLREMCRAGVIDATVDAAARDWGVARFSAGEDDLPRILDQARTVPMLAPRQVVIVTDLEAVEQQAESRRDAAIDELTAYLADPAPFTVLLLEAAALDQRMKLAKLLADKALVVAAELPQEPGLRLQMAAQLAVQMAREKSSDIDRDAAEQLAELCNSDLALIRSEIEKLALYVGPGQPVRRDDVAALVVSERRYSVWELADMLASQQRANAFKFLDNLLREGEQPAGLIGAMVWMFRKLLEAQEMAPNVSPGAAAGRLGMRVQAAQAALRHARKIPRRRLVDGLRALYEADSAVKSGTKNQRAVMEFLMARLVPAPPKS
jgi:DNA polymerase III subunit delta